MQPFTLILANTEAQFAAARELFVEYSERLGVDLCFQGFTLELAKLPSMYGAPSGTLILASTADGYIGCVGIRALDAGDVGDCEMKRLYVREAARGSGLGRRLVQQALSAARQMGYRRVLLDTLPQMAAARGLYASLGFRQIAAYYDNPIEGTTYMALSLQGAPLPPDKSPTCRQVDAMETVVRVVPPLGAQ